MAVECVKLLTHNLSPFAVRAVIAVELKGIEYENLPQDLRNKSELLLQSNPTFKKVPVLIHNGKSVSESSIIVQYVDEAWPEKAPFFPKDPYGRAQQRFWGDFVEKKIVEGLFKFVKSKDAESAAAANKEFIDNCKILEEELGKHSSGPYFGGQSMSFVDVMLAPFAVWIPAISAVTGLKQASQEECPLLVKLLGAYLEDPAAKVALPEIGKLKEFVANTLSYLRG